MHPHPSIRSMRIIGLSFIPVVVGGAIAIVALRSGWADRDDTLATVGLWVTAALGSIGLVVAARWRTAITERPLAAGGLTTSYFVTLALAESGMLAGLVFSIGARSVTPFVVGAAIFVVSLTLILTALNRVEVGSDDWTTGIVR
jgi:F0F1-type ATP synthase membrane subunit c/vacuolar-type H+-ATPase subunit K